MQGTDGLTEDRLEWEREAVYVRTATTVTVVQVARRRSLRILLIYT